MALVRKFFKIIGLLLLLVVIVIGLVLIILQYKNNYYYRFTKTEKPIEEKYTAPGEHSVSSKLYKTDNKDIKEFEIWYPEELKKENKKYPVVVIANGTGTPASSYKAFFRHLASWGFIVIGNEDENSRSGASSESSLSFLKKLSEDRQSIFFEKVDSSNVGIGGHSQGGVGAVNAVTSQPSGDQYKALYAVSATSPYWGQDSVFGTDWSYDLKKVKIPTFLTAGTGGFDSGEATNINQREGQGIAPLWSLQSGYKQLPEDIDKLIARKVGIDHGETYQAIDGYMTAWFLWYLTGDKEAKKAFKGANAEIEHNPLYQDVWSNIN